MKKKRFTRYMSVFLIVAVGTISMIGSLTVTARATSLHEAGPHHPTLTAARGNVHASQSNGVSFGAATDYPTNGSPDQIAKGDFNKDGKQDVVTTNPHQGTISVLLGHGDGTFAPAVSYATGGDPMGVAIGDVNGDGKLDIVTADHSSGNVSVLLGHGDGTFASAVTYPAHGQPWGIALGDVNGDGKLDIVTGNQTTGDISVLLNRGDGTFQAPLNTSDGHGTDTHGVALGDFNGDGKLDVAVADGGPPGADATTISVLLGKGDGTFGTPNVMRIGSTYESATYVVVADLNHDGKLDVVGVVSGCPSSDATIFLGNGDGTFQPGQSLGEQCIFYVSAADINGDGILDLVTVSGDSPYDHNSFIHVHLGNGDGTFQSAISFPVSPGLAAYSEVLLDLNGDGHPDVVTANLVTNDVSVLMNTTSQGNLTPSSTTAGGAPNTYPTTCSCGAPVNTSSGEFWHHFDDLAVPGRGMALDFNRTYSASLAAQDGPLGHGWTDSYQVALTTDPSTGNITIHAGNGSVVTFTLNGSVYQPPSYVLASLVKNGDGMFTYKANDQTSSVFSAAGQLLKEVDRNGYATTLTYTGAQLSKVTDPAARSLTFAYGSDSRIAGVTDPAGRKVSFSYDASGNLITATDVTAGVWKFSYDANHLMLTMTDPRNGVLTNIYDTSSRVISQTDAMSRKTIFAYAPGQNGAETTTLTDPKGNQTLYQYQNLELTAATKGYGTPQAATTMYTYDPVTHGVAKMTDPNGHITTSTYDSRGNLLTVIDALGHKTTNTYDSLNDLLTSQDPMGVTTTMTYDAAGNLLTTSRPLTGTTQVRIITYQHTDASHPGDITGIVDPNGKTSTLAYDTYGDVITAVDPLGNKATATYNTIGWKLTSVSPKGNVAGCGCSAQYTTTFAHDPDGRVTTVTDPLGHKAVSHYDHDRNLHSFTDADGNKTTYTYDADNELTMTTRADGTTLKTDYNTDGTILDQVDGKGKATTYKYDPLARAISVTDPLNRATSFTYDAAGNRLTMTDPQSQVTTYGYDAGNELISITYSDGKTAKVSGITYDADGRRTAMTDGTGTSTWTWDSLGRLTTSKNGAGSTVSYGYDLKGQLITLTYPSGKKVTRGYDNGGHLTLVSDWQGHRTKFGYDANSNLVTERLPNTTDIIDTFTFDNADRLTGISDAKSGAKFATFTYRWDSANQLTSQTATGVEQTNKTYTYTPLNQLKTVAERSYAYNAADDVTTLTSGATLTYDAANQLQRRTLAPDTWIYGFDARGNRTSITLNGGSPLKLVYDQANRLTSYGTKSTYTYNGDGLRMSKTFFGTTTQYTWADGLLLKDGAVAYVYGPGGVPLEQINGSTILYYHHDQLGSTRVLTDSSGTVKATYTFNAYGNTNASTGSVTNPFKYAGQYTDAESGMLYLRARYYDPTTAQFITRDPAVAMTRSPYGYVAGNPLNATDPSGNGPCASGYQFNSDPCPSPGTAHSYTATSYVTIKDLPRIPLTSEWLTVNWTDTGGRISNVNGTILTHGHDGGFLFGHWDVTGHSLTSRGCTVTGTTQFVNEGFGFFSSPGFYMNTLQASITIGSNGNWSSSSSAYGNNSFVNTFNAHGDAWSGGPSAGPQNETP